jgi:uncharacterized protein (TIGR02099 family)
MPLAERWRRLRAAYRMANRASHHVLGFTVKLVLLAYFLFALCFLFLRWAVLPNIDYYKGDIERLASRAVGNQVTIQRIYATWSGLRPSLFLGDVLLRDKQGRQVLTLPSVLATVSWWSVPALDVRFESLEIIRPEIDVRREQDGRLFVAGIALDPRQGDGKGADWALKQRHIAIREGRLTWTDLKRAAPPLVLDHVDLVLRNRWQHHQLALRATPPAALAKPLDVRADFLHPSFARRISDVSLWRGELYADLRDTDLAAWKRYLDYPFQLTHGYGSLRTWIALDQARLAGFTADVGLAGVSARLGKGQPPLNLHQVTGRISAREEFDPGSETGGRPTFGANGHTVRIENLALRGADGALLPPMSLEETWRPAAGKKAESFEVRARQLDLDTLGKLAAQLPMADAQRQLLADFAPRGRLADVVVQWEGSYPRLASYRIKGRVEGLGLNATPGRPAHPKTATSPATAAMPAIPGFDNLTGSVEASDKGGSFVLDSDQLVLRLPAWFEDPDLKLDSLDMKARWTFAAANQLLFEIDKLELAQGPLRATVKGSHRKPLAGGSPGVADLHATLDGFSVNTVGRYLPKATPPGLAHWLSTALESGTLNDTTVRLRGDLQHFPFRDHSKGEFKVEGKIAEGRLNYEPGHFARDGVSPLWPTADRINGSIVFDRARMEIRGDTAKTLGVSLANIKAVVPDLGAAEGMLEIDGNAYGPLQEYFRYVAASPVLDWIGHFTEGARASGAAKLGLKLRIPLAHPNQTKVNGVLQLQSNDIVLFPELPTIQATMGKIDFNERGVGLTGVGASFLGGPLAVTGGSQKDGSIAIRLSGGISGDGLRKAYPTAAMHNLVGQVQGATRFTGLVTVKDHMAQVTIDSNLAGLQVDLPAPLKKAAADIWPTRFVLADLAPAEGLSRDEIRLSLGNAVAARYLRTRTGRGPWIVQRGGIGVNNPAPEPDSGLTVNVNLKSLNVDQWTRLGNAIAGAPGGKASASGQSSAAELAQYVVPDVTAARATELIIGDRKLDDVVVGATHTKDNWQASIDSRQIAGYVTWDEGPRGQGLGKVTARLSSLIIPESAKADVKELLEGGEQSATSMPGVDVVAEHFELFNKKLGKLELVANNNLTSGVGRDWRISKLALDNPDGELRGTGNWTLRDGKSSTSMNFNLDIQDAGKLLDRLGFPETLRRGKGKMAGDLSWNGLPYSLDAPSLSGRIDLDLGSGQFLKQDPGAAKLLGLLSLQSLPRLLKLDFTDVFSEGLAFDGISANAVIARGVLSTDNLRMHGVSATVLMDGTADIANETANLHVVVIPEFNLGTGPLVYAIAVNPVVGLGSFLAQLFLRAPVMKALTYHMQVTGPWKAPVITKLATPLPEPAAKKEKP